MDFMLKGEFYQICVAQPIEFLLKKRSELLDLIEELGENRDLYGQPYAKELATVNNAIAAKTWLAYEQENV